MMMMMMMGVEFRTDFFFIPLYVAWCIHSTFASCFNFVLLMCSDGINLFIIYVHVSIWFKWIEWISWTSSRLQSPVTDHYYDETYSTTWCDDVTKELFDSSFLQGVYWTLCDTSMTTGCSGKWPYVFSLHNMKWHEMQIRRIEKWYPPESTELIDMRCIKWPDPIRPGVMYKTTVERKAGFHFTTDYLKAARKLIF